MTHDSARVAVVTGASRGAGRGIAAALSGRGWRVYLTGRTVSDPLDGGIPVRVDHRDDADVARLFERVGQECGRLDLLVNNAAAVHDELVSPKPFWEKPLELGDVLDVGLRSAYVASWYAAPLMVGRGRGLIAFTSSPGSLVYMHGPAYGAQKAGVDKLAADMAVDFEGTGVATASIWMGILLTEKFVHAFDGHPEALAKSALQAETPEFTGHVIDALYRDPALVELSGQTLIGAELATRYGIVDADATRRGHTGTMRSSPQCWLTYMDGVLVHEERALPGAADFLQRLVEKNRPFLVLTNNSIFTPRDLAARLLRSGLEVPEESIWTSALATAAFLHDQLPGGSAYVIGEAGLTTALHEVGYTLTDTGPDFVVLGETRTYSFEAITKAIRLIGGGARFIATNPDVTGPSAEGPTPATGSVAALITKATGRDPYFVGKPNPMMFRSALNRIEAHSENTFMVGDRMDTDVVAGIEAGLETILVLTGSTKVADIEKYPFRPSRVLDSIADAIELI